MRPNPFRTALIAGILALPVTLAGAPAALADHDRGGKRHAAEVHHHDGQHRRADRHRHGGHRDHGHATAYTYGHHGYTYGGHGYTYGGHGYRSDGYQRFYGHPRYPGHGYRVLFVTPYGHDRR